MKQTNIDSRTKTITILMAFSIKSIQSTYYNLESKQRPFITQNLWSMQISASAQLSVTGVPCIQLCLFLILFPFPLPKSSNKILQFPKCDPSLKKNLKKTALGTPSQKSVTPHCVFCHVLWDFTPHYVGPSVGRSHLYFFGIFELFEHTAPAQMPQ